MMAGAGDVRVEGLPRARFALWAVLFVAVLTYSSTIVGPVGVNFVPQDPAAAWARLLGVVQVWVDNGSDQRPDWMANLTTLVPFGFLVAGAMLPRQGWLGIALGSLASAALTLVVVFAIKYLQLW